MRTERPWGAYTVLATENNFQVKKLEVNPGGKTSLQSHEKRAEHWVVVSGVASVLVGEEEKILEPEDSVFIPKGSKHRLENRGQEPLVLVEVQVGNYFGEDDIVRFEDIYGRL